MSFGRRSAGSLTATSMIISPESSAGYIESVWMDSRRNPRMLGTPLPEEETAIEEIANILNGFLRSLDARDEFIFICRYYYSDHISNIAQMVGLSESTVYRSLADIRDRLRALLEAEGHTV